MSAPSTTTTNSTSTSSGTNAAVAVASGVIERSVDNKVPLPNSNCGAFMRSQGFGTWRGDNELVGKAVKLAVKAGYRLIDCARMYGNEKAIGKAIAELLEEKVVKRDELYIVGKIWNTDHAPETVRAATLKTIKDLQCGYLDCLLMHWPVAWVHPQGGDCENQTEWFNLNPQTGGSVIDEKISTIDTYRAMERLVDEGLVRDIGVSNFSISEIERLLSADGLKYKPVANQIELHPSLPQDELTAFNRSKGIVTMSYKPYAISSTDFASSLMHNEELSAIAKKEGLPSTAQLLLQWNCQRGNVVLCKSTTESRIAANANVPCGGLSDETMAAVSEFSTRNKRRLCNPDNFTATKAPFFGDQ